jgi:hypothetical protein
MKTKMNLLFVCLAALSLIIAACGSQDKKNTSTGQDSTKSQTTTNVIYTCPMHPEVTSDKPGKCPKCGMDLVIKKSADNNNKMNMDSTQMNNMKK